MELSDACLILEALLVEANKLSNDEFLAINAILGHLQSTGDYIMPEGKH